MRILVVRNDKIGDFTLALPSFALLRRAVPGAEIHALVPAYTSELAAMSPDIDDVLVDPGPDRDSGAPRALARAIAEREYDAAIVLYSTLRIGAALLLARVPYRLAPATKFAQLLYRHRLVQRRSRSEKPEYEYNLDLVRHFLTMQGIGYDDGLHRPVLPVPAAVTVERRHALAERHGLDPEAVWIGAHPGHGGSANNLSVDQYAKLLDALNPGPRCAIVITAGPGESRIAHALRDTLQSPVRVVHESTQGLGRFVEDLAVLDLVIGGSTGPLHLAGALDRRTVMFYPRRRSSTSLRWQSLNEESRRIAFEPPATAPERDMGAINLDAAAAAIREAFPDLLQD